jgi:hypothetical protein
VRAVFVAGMPSSLSSSPPLPNASANAVNGKMHPKHSCRAAAHGQQYGVHHLAAGQHD